MSSENNEGLLEVPQLDILEVGVTRRGEDG